MRASRMVVHRHSWSTSFAMSCQLARTDRLSDIQLRRFPSNDVTRTSSLVAMPRATVAGWLRSPLTWVDLGSIQGFVIFGSTPMLLGRPVLELLEAVVDFGGRRMKLMGGDWQEIKNDATLYA